MMATTIAQRLSDFMQESFIYLYQLDDLLNQNAFKNQAEVLAALNTFLTHSNSIEGFEVLDKNGAEYEKTDASTILAEMSVYGNLSRFSVSVNEQETGTELTVTMIHPCEGLSDTGIRRATTAIADSISQHLENELVINKLKA